jgi:hypothetical protein
VEAFLDVAACEKLEKARTIDKEARPVKLGLAIVFMRLRVVFDSPLALNMMPHLRRCR